MLDKLVDALSLIEDTYSMIVMMPRGMAACRDPLGIRPLAMGWLGGAVVLASEAVALHKVGAKLARHLDPSEFIDTDYEDDPQPVADRIVELLAAELHIASRHPVEAD